MLLKDSVSKTLTVLTSHFRFKSTASQTYNLNRLLLNMSRKNDGNPGRSSPKRQQPPGKDKGTKYCPGTVTLQILGCGGSGSPGAVYLFTDQSRYLFNCGEGTQRLAHEHKTKLSRLEHIFLTRTSWERIGGLPGLSLTVQDAGVRNLTLHGPPGLDEIFKAMRRFVILKNLKVDAETCEERGVYEDEVMTVQYILIDKKPVKMLESSYKWSLSDLELDNTDYYEYENGRNSDSPSPPLVLDYNKREENVVICYICKLKPKPGALNLEKCVDKGVPPGPLLGQLKNGKDITLPDGTVVTAEEVTAPSDPGPVFIFIDIPSVEYLTYLKDKKYIFREYNSNASVDHNAALCVVHFSPAEIVNTEIYDDFMGDFPASTKHLVLNGSNKFSGYTAAHRIQWQLNQIDENIFPLLKECPDLKCDKLHISCKTMKFTPPSESSDTLTEELAAQTDSPEEKRDVCQDGYIDLTNSLTAYHLRPLKGLDRSNEAILDPASYLEEAYKINNFNESLELLKQEMAKARVHKNRETEFPKILFLGTGSCIPNKTRNVSSILIHSSPDACILLDCGEGTWGQMIRFYGEEEATDLLAKLKLIYISHLHADHHIGLINILNTRRDILGKTVEPIILLAPKQINAWLYFYNQRIEPIGDTFTLVSNDTLVQAPYTNPALSQMGIKSISTCLVRHCPFAYGIAIHFNNPQDPSDLIKITYSGDTAPCDELVNLGNNSTLLLHEATMEDELVEEARRKRHSTVSEAIEQGRKMNAKYTILTHFSQRYAKIPRINTALAENVGVAFDNMEVTISELNLLHLMYPTLKILFSEHFEEMEQKALKRSMKLERKKQQLQEQGVAKCPTR